MHLLHNSLPFLPPASCFGHAQKSKFWDSFWTFLFSPFVSFLLQWLTFYCACLQLKKTSEKASLRQVIFGMEHPGVVAGNFALNFSLSFLSIFVHIWGSMRPITLIWASLERSFPPAEVECKWCQFWSKVMMSEEEERPRFVTGGTGVNRLSIVKGFKMMPKNSDITCG